MVAERYRKLLAGQLGNLLSRSTSVALNPSQEIPRAPSLENVHNDDKFLNLRLQTLPEAVEDAMSQFKTSQATQAIFEVIAEVS
jgi:methionyl-tRNA synthetase